MEVHAPVEAALKGAIEDRIDADFVVHELAPPSSVVLEPPVGEAQRRKRDRRGRRARGTVVARGGRRRGGVVGADARVVRFRRDTGIVRAVRAGVVAGRRRRLAAGVLAGRAGGVGIRSGRLRSRRGAPRKTQGKHDGCPDSPPRNTAHLRSLVHDAKADRGPRVGVSPTGANQLSFPAKAGRTMARG